MSKNEEDTPHHYTATIDVDINTTKESGVLTYLEEIVHNAISEYFERYPQRLVSLETKVRPTSKSSLKENE